MAGTSQTGTSTVTSMSCDDTGTFLNNNAGQTFKVVRAGTVTLSYQASGLPQTVKLPTSAFDPGKVVKGGSVMVYVNPNRLNEVKTDITWADLVRSMLVMTGSIVLALLGMILYRLAAPCRRSRHRTEPSLEDDDEEGEEYDDGDEDDDDSPRIRVFEEDEDLFEPPPARPPPRKRVGM